MLMTPRSPAGDPGPGRGGARRAGAGLASPAVVIGAVALLAVTVAATVLGRLGARAARPGRDPDGVRHALARSPRSTCRPCPGS